MSFYPISALGNGSFPSALASASSAADASALFSASSTGSSNPYEAVDRVFDLSRGDSGRRDLFDAIGSLKGEDRDAFLTMTASLLQSGMTGYELFQVGREPYQSFVLTRSAEDITRGASYYRDRAVYPRTLDVSA